MAVKNKNTLLWLENSEKTIRGQLFFARKIFSVEMVSQLHQFRSILEDDNHAVKAIVLDIMLYRVYDLDALGIQGVDTDMGYEAGWRVLEHYLRTPQSQFKHIPVLVLSARALREKDQELLDRLNQQKGVAPTKFIEKHGYLDWYKDFEEWIVRASSGRMQ
jgi:CheY-like chemotaxis protein